jgi:hypothetical protein
LFKLKKHKHTFYFSQFMEYIVQNLKVPPKTSLADETEKMAVTVGRLKIFILLLGLLAVSHQPTVAEKFDDEDEVRLKLVLVTFIRFAFLWKNGNSVPLRLSCPAVVAYVSR